MISEIGRCASCHRDSGGRPLCGACDVRARTSFAYVSGDGEGNYEDAFFTLLERLEPRSFWFRSRNDLIVWVLQAYVGAPARFLEVGCGTGYVLAAIHARIPQMEVMGAELFPQGLEVARRRLPGVPLVQMTALEIPFRSSFDAVGAFDVLEHIEDDEMALREMRRAVPRGGRLVLTVPQHPRLWSAADELAGHVRRYRRDELVGKVRRTGWETVRVSSFVTLPLALVALSRARRADAYDLERELQLPAALDRGLGALMRAERSLLTHSISFPVGGSLLMVARAAG